MSGVTDRTPYRGEGDATPCCGATTFDERCRYSLWHGAMPGPLMKQAPTMPAAQHAMWLLRNGATIDQVTAATGIVGTVVGTWARRLGVIRRAAS